MIIGVTKLSENYKNWLLKLNRDLEIVDLYTLTEVEIDDLIARLSGILFSGGSDIHPLRYHRVEDMVCCKQVDPRRDAMEISLINQALELKIPVFGICRGQQMLNIAGGGTLYADIPTFCESPLEHSNKEDVYHSVQIDEDSQLYRISGVREGIVNSSHHQAIGLLGEGLSATACSPDGIIEAIEAGERIDHPFYMAVQWHPERMNPEDPLSGKIGNAFIQACKNHDHRSNSSRIPMQSS
jgi:putative glutamine amidotransferase